MFTAEQVDQQFLKLVNDERRRNGLSPVTLNAQLDEAAQRHSEDLALNDWYNESNPHIGSDGSTRISRVQDTGYRYESPQGEPFENIAVGQFTPEEAFADWLASPGHRENILTPNVNHIGIGHTFLENDTGENNYFDYWLIVLAKGQPAPAPVPPALEIPEIVIPEESIEPEPPVVETPDETPVLEPPTTEMPENVPAVETPDSETEVSDATTTSYPPDTEAETPNETVPDTADPEAQIPSETAASDNSELDTELSDEVVSDISDPDTAASDTETFNETITSDSSDAEPPATSPDPDTSADISQDEVVVSQTSDLPVQDSSAADASQDSETQPPVSENSSTPPQNSTNEADSTATTGSDQVEIDSTAAIETVDAPVGRPAAVVAGGNDNSDVTNQEETGEGNPNPPSQTLLGTEGDDSLEAGPETTLVAGGWGNDEITGSDRDDVLRGDLNERDPGGTEGGDDLIFGGAGNDYIGGKGGNDTLVGGTGDDQIWGDDGDDILRGGLGNDILTGDNFSGGSGADTFILAAGAGTDLIMDFELGTDRIGLADGLTYADLSFGQSDGMATIFLTSSGEVLAEVKEVMPDALTSEMFTVI